MAWTAPRTWTDGELVTKAIMDPHVRDNFLAVGPHLIVRKTADESVTSSVVLQNDDVLLMAVAANEIWKFELSLLVTGNATGDFFAAFTFPTSGTISAHSVHNGAGGTVALQLFSSTTSPTSGRSFGLTNGSPPESILISGVYVNGANAGNLQLQWAQNVSDATATVVKANSTLWAVKLA